MISKDKIMDIKTRRDIYQFISNNPGLHTYDLSKKMNMPVGIESRLKSIYHGMMLEMADKYESVPRIWYDSYFKHDSTQK